MTPNKSINWGNISMAEWSQKSKNNGNFYNTYSLSKNKYNKDTKKVETVGSLNLDRKEHADLILYLLSRAGNTEAFILNYKLQPVLNKENKIIGQELSKSYKDKDGNDKINKIDLIGTDIIYLKTVLNTFVRLFVNCYEHQSNNNSYDESSDGRFIDTEENFESDSMNDDIPF